MFHVVIGLIVISVVTVVQSYDKLFVMNAAGIAEKDRRVINLLVWTAFQDERRLPAVLLGIDRAKNDSILPKYTMVNVRMVYGCQENPQQLRGSLDLKADMTYFETKFPENSRIHGLVGPRSTTCAFSVHTAKRYIISCKVNFGQTGNSAIQLAGSFHTKYWNIPIIPDSSIGVGLSVNRQKYPTLSRVALTGTAMANGVLKLMQHFDWRQVSLIRGTASGSNTAHFTYLAVRTVLKQNNVAVNYDTWISADRTDEEQLDVILDDIRAVSRIVLIVSTGPCGDELNFMRRANKRYMIRDDMVYITVHPEGLMLNTENKTFCNFQNETENFEGLNTFQFTFRGMTENAYSQGHEIIKPYGATPFWDIMEDINMADATYAMLHALGETLYDRGWAKIGDGTFVNRKNLNKKVEGAIAPIWFDKTGDRFGEFQLVAQHPSGSYELMTFDMVATQINETIYRDLVANVTIPPFPDGIPLEEPPCLFDNSGCPIPDYTYEAIGVVGSCIVLVLLFILYRWNVARKHKALLAMAWRVDLDNVLLVEDDQLDRSTASSYQQSTSMYSVKDAKEPLIKYVDLKNGFGKTMIERQDDQPSVWTKDGEIAGVRCQLSLYTQTRAFEKFPVASLKLLDQLRGVTTDNLNTFMGIAFNQHDKFTVIWKYEARCTLYDVIGNSDLSLSADFQNSFLNDICNGVDYLHSNATLAHGRLNLHTCVITQQWTIRISQFGLNAVLKTAGNMLNIPQPTRHEWLHVAPEHNNFTETSLSGDIYSFGVIAFEVLQRVYIEEEAGKYVPGEEFNKSHSRPPMNWMIEGKECGLAKIVKPCVDTNVAVRPFIGGLKKQLNKDIKAKMGGDGIVDHMMKMMSTYAHDLERLVGERTASLEETQRRADRLLNQLLPRSVAEDLKAGRIVEPELYSSATIGFVDIVQFTNLCAASTPFDIVSLLNELFSMFDGIVATHEAYKVETIGDAYMIVSGIPLRNGDRHASDICGTLCGMLAAAQTVKVSRISSDYRVTLRGGVHTGPTAAGVVGIHAPRYCLFGDTVNTSSRMESHGLPNKVHVSQYTVDCLELYGKKKFNVKFRDEIEVKGKGLMNTYWVSKKT